MRFILALMLVFVMATSAVALDITYTMTSANAQRVVAMLKDFESGMWAEIVAEEPTWNDNQIAKEVIRRRIRDNVRRYEGSIAGTAADQAVLPDDTVIE